MSTLTNATHQIAPLASHPSEELDNNHQQAKKELFHLLACYPRAISGVVERIDKGMIHGHYFFITSHDFEGDDRCGCIYGTFHRVVTEIAPETRVMPLKLLTGLRKAMPGGFQATYLESLVFNARPHHTPDNFAPLATLRRWIIEYTDIYGGLK